MKHNFSPSINININEIDLDQYFITSNVQAVFDAIINNYQSGIRSINLVGAYGTGKSSFLSAFSQHISGSEVFYEAKNWTKCTSFRQIKIVGGYESFVEVFADAVNAKSFKTSDLIEAFVNLLKRYNGTDTGILLIVDEFGKLLEYASKNQPEKELYFLQQIAEIINSGDYDVIWITTLHQDFAAYAGGLTRIQRNEWTKVKGRFKEITFNEPVEQLLYLASKRLSAEVPEKLKQNFKNLFQAVIDAKVYPLRDFFSEEVAAKLYPMDILSTAILALALQQYGQNERSLFSFLNGDNYYDLKDFDTAKSNFYSAAHVYDFLNYNLNSFLLSKANPNYAKWAEIRNALERVEGEFDFKKQSIYHQVVKTIGLFQVFLPGSAKVNKSFLAVYLAGGGEPKDFEEAIEELEQRFIIRYYERTHKYTLFEASDVDIDLAINEAGMEVSMANDVVKYLNAYFTFPTISAKRAYFNYGTPRVFQFKISDNPYSSSIPEGEIDGYVNLIFNPYLTVNDIRTVSANTNDAVLFGLYKNSDEMKSLIEEIEKAEIAKEKHKTDRIAKRELDSIIDLQKNLLNHYVMHSFYNNEVIEWFYRGEEVLKIANNRDFNSKLSDICEIVYPDSPVFKSELANKSRLSPAVSTARKDLFKALIEQYDQEDLAIAGFPPQKSIYYSLLKETTIHRKTDLGWSLHEPVAENDPYNFLPLFNVSNDFVNSSKGAKRSVSELYELLSKSPFKLKRGFLDFWIPVFLLMKRADYALYGENGFITDLDGEVLELLVKRPKEYAIKAFDVDGIRIDLFNQYRTMLDLAAQTQTSNESFIQTIVPYIKFYKGLNPYAKHTKRISKQSQRIRKALTEATDPETLFFEDFPAALGFDIIQLTKKPELLKVFADALQLSIRELRTVFDELQNRFENVINSLWNTELSFVEYKDKLRARYQLTLKQYLLLPYQRTFYDRLCSPLEDRRAWLSSVSQAVIGKTLENINDEEEMQLFDKFNHWIHELDNLNDIAEKQVDLEKEDVFKLEITTPGKRLSNQLIRLPKIKVKRFTDLEIQLSSIIDQENTYTKIAILAEMLRKELDKNGK
jgi:hypothetical protein